MHTFMIITAITGTILVYFLLYMLRRNRSVFDERMRMLERCDPYSSDYQDRHAEYKEHSYDEMLFKFWKPVKSFYREYQ